MNEDGDKKALWLLQLKKLGEDFETTYDDMIKSTFLNTIIPPAPLYQFHQ